MTSPRQPTILAMVMAGGKGERLYPMTEQRTKPAVPFAGKYRIVDFALSNLMNSKITACYVLVQYRSQSLIEHLRAGWPTRGLTSREFLTVVPPQMQLGEHWYRGTADAVVQNVNLIKDFRPDIVAIFSGDHVYRMDVRQMVAFHLEHEADVTIAARPVPLDEAARMGMIEADSEDRVISFEEKPENPKPMPGNPGMSYSSMGNYLFNAEALIRIATEERYAGEYDFGKSVLPGLIHSAKVCAYNFRNNEVPGAKPYEEKGYWRDVGTVLAYWQAHMDLLGPEPRFDLYNPKWPILGSHNEGPAMRVLKGALEDSLIAEGCLIKDAVIRKSILGRGVRVEAGAIIEESIIMDHAVIGKGARLRRVIVDRFNVVADGADIGGIAEMDGKRYFKDASGLIVLPRAPR
ncbi:MAG: glucose-1-phosphate adenylyltransferase [Elusimicrobiota bacterium]